MGDSPLLRTDALASGSPSASGASVEAPAAGMRLVRVERFEAAGVAALQGDAYRRRFATLFLDEGSARRGGVGEVLRAVNARGECFAVKRLNHGGTLPVSGNEGEPKAEERRILMRALLDAEYDAHCRLAGLKGFPRLYGRGEIEGEPAIIMEWVEGITLEKAARALAIDEAGRISPLAAARIGRDLFDLLASMDYLADGLAHRDVSLRNVMVDTGRLSLTDQVEEGTFELRLIDFGSAAVLADADGSVTARCGAPRGAAADFAPPEMLTNDRADVEALRRSPAVDVYAAASVLYALLEGRPPYDLGFGAAAERGTFSAYRVKTEYAPEPPGGAHASAADIAAVLSREPEVAVAVGRAAATVGATPTAARVRLALSQVDDALAPILGACLAPRAADRPSAAAVREALVAFCTNYGENIGRALRGEPLIACPLGGAAAASARSRTARRRVIRGVARAACAALWLVAVAGTGMLVSGMEASVVFGDVRWEGIVPGWVASLLLALPAMLGIGLRERDVASRGGMLRGVTGTLFGVAAAAGALALVAWPTSGVAAALYAALFLATAAPLCALVADYALGLPQAAGSVGPAQLVDRRPVLPRGAVPVEEARAALASRDTQGVSASQGEEACLVTYELAEE